MSLGAIARSSRYRAGLLGLWFAASFGWVFFADQLQWVVAGWPVAVWLAAQGGVLLFVGIVVVWAYWANRHDPASAVPENPGDKTIVRRLNLRFTAYVLALLAFVAALGIAESAGLSKGWVAGIFLFSTLVLYAVIGIRSRTADAAEYYVAGRRIPA
ncbi:MAG: cation acetate symporter, partial [Burkholderiales bacterium PBB4]